MAPAGPDLSVLLTVLAEHRVEVELTSNIGAGVALASVNLERFSLAIAVIPSEHGYSATSLPAIYVEIGVATGRGLPLLVISESPGQPLPALAGLTMVVTEFGNYEAQRLQIGLFLRQIGTTQYSQPVQAPVPSGRPISVDYSARLNEIRESSAGLRALAFEQLVGDLLRGAGAQVEQSMSGPGDLGVDAAAFIPGEEGRLGTVMIQVKSGTLQGHTLRVDELKLSTLVARARAGLGLLVYDRIAPDARKIPNAPLVSRLGIDELLTELEIRPLSAVLTEARNRAVHGL